MKPTLFAILGASLISANAVQAHPHGPSSGNSVGRAHYNSASTYSRGYADPAYSQSRAQSWYSDTGWQPGMSAINTYGYGYGYGGAAAHPPVVVAAPYQGQAIYGQSVSQVERSQPFGYVVDGYGRYPWNRTVVYSQAPHQGYSHGYSQSYAAPAPQPVYYQSAPIHISQPPIYVQGPPVYVEPAQVHVAAPQVEVAPPQIHYDQGYFAVPAQAAPPPPPPPPSPTERPYRQEGGERG